MKTNMPLRKTKPGMKHPNCTAFFEDFNRETLFKLCEECLGWGSECYGGAHPRKFKPQRPQPAENSPIMDLSDLLKATKVIPVMMIDSVANELRAAFPEEIQGMQRAALVRDGLQFAVAYVSKLYHVLQHRFCSKSKEDVETMFNYSVIRDFGTDKIMFKFAECLSPFPD